LEFTVTVYRGFREIVRLAFGESTLIEKNNCITTARAWSSNLELLTGNSYPKVC